MLVSLILESTTTSFAGISVGTDVGMNVGEGSIVAVDSSAVGFGFSPSSVGGKLLFVTVSTLDNGATVLSVLLLQATKNKAINANNNRLESLICKKLN